MQGMDNGNSAIDALIASASMQTGVVSPKSPHYQEGGRMNEVPYQSRFEEPIDESVPLTPYEKAVWDIVYGGIGKSFEEMTPAEREGLGAKYRKEWIKHSIQGWPLYEAPADSIFKEGGTRYKDFEEWWNSPEPWGAESHKFRATKGIDYQQGGEVGVGLEDLIGRITGERKDITRAGMQDIMSKIAFHESGGTGDIGLKQYGGGPGRGVYQFERGAAQGGATAGNRLANQLEVYGMEVPKWLKSFNKSGKGDVSGLSRDKQDMLFLGNMLQHPQANMGEVISGDMGLAEFWQQYHQAGGADVKDARIAAFAESMGGYSPDRRRGGPVYGYQQGGQVLPRKQQEMRSPDSGSADMDSLLKQIMMRGVNQSTGDSTASTVLDSMKMQQGGMVGGTPLMQDMSQDKRVKPLQPDRYVVTGGKMTKQEMEVPKLSRAYLASFGMETPLSKRQRSVLNRRAIAPETLSPQVKGLIGRILVQRLTNEPE